MNLELRHLRSLVAVADAQTFTDAAIALGTSQASVSRSVAAAEQALGMRVFQRTTRSVTPTAGGQRIIEHARRVLDEARLLEEAVRDHAAEIRVGYAWSAVGSRTPGPAAALGGSEAGRGAGMGAVQLAGRRAGQRNC